MCPIQNDLPSYDSVSSYVACAKNKSVRSRGSSGGLFGVAASYIISQGGVVFGASFDSI